MFVKLIFEKIKFDILKNKVMKKKYFFFLIYSISFCIIFYLSCTRYILQINQFFLTKYYFEKKKSNLKNKISLFHNFFSFFLIYFHRIKRDKSNF